MNYLDFEELKGKTLTTIEYNNGQFIFTTNNDEKCELFPEQKYQWCSESKGNYSKKANFIRKLIKYVFRKTT